MGKQLKLSLVNVQGNKKLIIEERESSPAPPATPDASPVPSVNGSETPGTAASPDASPAPSVNQVMFLDCIVFLHCNIPLFHCWWGSILILLIQLVVQIIS
ncbi:hypothetical protein LIER_06669 [Lithospermum erythrorhizon]|uniref:Uncharacterized protein n=1 Tax=Lithospermum erythrorhizon TaxID=34254 RepID=A0AAV3P5D2_LITER